ncbi:GNAT family N-acetyltransferase [Flavobacterium oreochromis]|uniref:N-acetyltransferase domain-containing protein n=2 Tax=Flavobacterium TaxID=237 RepID=A0A2D0AI55_9FLAO|nr:GNAT family N-acetyltransferase [Flavobacterium oreochromis]OWP77158.1 hypothetical protein BWG23_06150 [Flavobacterium oreochromis]OWP79489.1 hypothetical protein BWK62_02000 [Flavobacterium oreochromis]POR28387.1 hypothetical protein BWK58_03475 [Flavobacterium columnare]QYS85314.1 GNAT family N-acetyltransferase [Flavobacterium oreochromis]
MIKEVKILNSDHKLQLLNLWNTEYPVSLHYKNHEAFEDYLSKIKNQRHFLYITDTGKITGWAYSFNREEERWFAIILSHTIQGKGIGKMMIKKIQTSENKLFGWVIDHNNSKKSNGEVYISPLIFYKKCGFDVLINERLETEILSAVKIYWNKELITLKSK